MRELGWMSGDWIHGNHCFNRLMVSRSRLRLIWSYASHMDNNSSLVELGVA